MTTNAQQQTRTFTHTSVFNTTLEAITEFHADPAAFSKLTPPPIFIQMHHRDLPTLTQGEVDFTMWIGPVPVRWHAQHEPGPTEHSFVDVMADGPMAHWRHEHIFEETSDGVQLTDRVTLAHKPGITGVFTRLMFDGLPLKLFFTYRHLRTRLAL